MMILTQISTNISLYEYEAHSNTKFILTIKINSRFIRYRVCLQNKYYTCYMKILKDP